MSTPKLIKSRPWDDQDARRGLIDRAVCAEAVIGNTGVAVLPEPLSTDFATARRQVYDAIRDCRAFGAHIRWGDPVDFQFTGRSGAECVVAGGQLSSVKDAKLEVQLPSRAVMRMIGNGKKLFESTGDSCEFSPTEPGIYRVEAWKQGRCWIFSNHIRIGV